MATLVLFNKPYGVLSQFTDGDNRPTLAQYIKLPNVYPAGRLDHDSEGLLLLTDDGDLQHHISHPAHKQPKTYWVQVEGAPNSYALTKLRLGVELNDGMTQPAEVRLIPTPNLWERVPPIRTRVNIPTQWLEIVITEGRNRQVRRMTAAVGHPTLRLVRVKIGDWTLEGIEQGKYKTETVQPPKSTTKAGVNGARAKNNNVKYKPASKKPGTNTSSANKPNPNKIPAKKTTSAPQSKSAAQGANKTAHTTKPVVKTLVIQKPKPKRIVDTD
ncbi:pseudouridine synthase [Cellvibrio sp.]|uniref:pseudouridine synthase n=1 Tax=Cellvibrio sp. TaxID=1965322 RepID=UPI00374E2C41